MQFSKIKAKVTKSLSNLWQRLAAPSAAKTFLKKFFLAAGRHIKLFAAFLWRHTKIFAALFWRYTKIFSAFLWRSLKAAVLRAAAAAKPHLKAFPRKLYVFLYVVGIQSMRVLKRFNKRAKRFLAPLGRLLLRAWRATLGRYLHSLYKSISHEHALIREGRAAAAQRMFAAKKHGGFYRVKENICAVGNAIALHRRVAATILNIAAPAAAIVALMLTVNYWNGLNFGLVLNYDGQEIATIENERVFEQATEMVNQRMVHDTSMENDAMDITPTFTLSVVDQAHYAAANSVCNQIIQQSNGIIEEATGLYVDGALMGAVKSGADLTYILQNILNGVKGDDTEAQASFVQNVDTQTGLYPTASLVSSEAMKKELTGTSQAAVTYTVKEGDTLTSIAKAHNMALDELIALNQTLVEIMHPGDLANIQVAVPRLGVELTKIEVTQVTLPFKTITQKDNAKYTDYSKVTVPGSNGTQERTDQVTTVNGVETRRENLKTVTTTEPVDKVVITGTKKRPNYSGDGVSSGTLMWPVPACRVITTGFQYRWGSFHTGIDITGNANGKAIVAADGGRVIASGYDGSYGYRIIIDHGNGLKTLYAHSSKLLVGVGTKVSKGQTIALVGSTGNSTGPHCHFEVRKNNVIQNPLNYVRR